MILMREITPLTMRRGTVVASLRTPSTRKRTRMLGPVGLEVDVGGAALDRLGDDLVDELDDRRVVGRLAQVDDLGRARSPPPRRPPSRSTTSSRRVRRLIRPDDVVGRGDRRAHVVARHQRDVVDREDVDGVGHRDGERPVAGEGDGHRLVALGRRAGEQVGGRQVDVEDVQVEVVEAVALGDRAGEPLGRQRPRGHQHLLRRRAGLARDLDGLVDALASARGRARRSRRSGSAAPAQRREACVTPSQSPACAGAGAGSAEPTARRWGTSWSLMVGKDGPVPPLASPRWAPGAGSTSRGSARPGGPGSPGHRPPCIPACVAAARSAVPPSR